MQSYVNNGMVDGLFSDIKDKIYKLAEGLLELTDDTKIQWKEYFISNALTVKYKWEQLVAQHETFIKNREIMGLPKYDNPEVVQAAEIKDPSALGWTEEDEKYLTNMYSMVDKIIKYASELQQGKREIAWDTTLKDVTLLGNENEPAIYLDSKNNFQLVNWETTGGPVEIIPASYQFSRGSGQIAASPLGLGPAIAVIILYGIIAIGVVAILMKGLDVLGSHIAAAEAKDLRRQEDEIIKGVVKEGGTTKEGVELAKGLTLANANAIKIQEDARKQPTKDPTMEALKTIAWVTLGIAVVGGGVYAIYKFVPDKPKERVASRSELEGYTGRMVPALAAAENKNLKLYYEVQTYHNDPNEIKEFEMGGPGWLSYERTDIKSIADRHKNELEKDGFKVRILKRSFPW